jgi:hypothetical protein
VWWAGTPAGRPENRRTQQEAPCYCGRAADGCAGHWLRFLCRTLITSLRFLSDKAVLPLYVLEVLGSSLDTRLAGLILFFCAMYSQLVRDVALVPFTSTFSSFHFIHVPGSSVGVVTSLRVQISVVGRLPSPIVQPGSWAHPATYLLSTWGAGLGEAAAV